VAGFASGSKSKNSLSDNILPSNKNIQKYKNAETKASARSLNKGSFSYLWWRFVAPDGDPRRKITGLPGVVISLSVTNPRITEWLRPESVFRLPADTFDSCNYQTAQNSTRFLAILRIDKGVLHNSVK